ncbi:hypothetical protein J3T65_02735 [Staphylococcus simiae]|uniref:hypothetical protein n=1 Tax=Staphylococcus simiae TaxID=308354 RepID=UPI001A98F919|nr:hypothetical protein [Staphylococcus simiae]MBO1198382.1 hypothetical protein [Staphylococcus simiae]MBO1200576.1 hypothetical protein [Staphylococcus simiae]MBO1202847.1 hypothetical protein [Staphylococcus simiae]MBO1210374.1 hypothetical protein [Staphylococcus simiae]MBO1228913.1 hypothetical protein [Staphylococcus simiae]
MTSRIFIMFFNMNLMATSRMIKVAKIRQTIYESELVQLSNVLTLAKRKIKYSLKAYLKNLD